MTIASGVFKTVAAKAETTWGTAPTASGAQYFRRVTSNLNLTKKTYESQEIRTDQQVADFRHGARSVTGGINGEFSNGTYQAFIEAMLRQASTAVATLTGLTLTTAASGAFFTATRSAGDWNADGMRVGMVFQVTAGLQAGSLNRNFVVVTVTTTVLTFDPVDSLTVAAQSAVPSCTITVPGKRTMVPSSGHTNISFTIEEFHSDIGLSRLFTGCKPTQMQLKLPATGMSTSDFTFLGKDITVNTSQYYTSPTAANSNSVMAAVNGAVYVGGTQIALITGLDLTVQGGHTVGETIGSNTTPDVFVGRVRANGQATVYLQDQTFLNYFVNESIVSISAVLAAGSAASNGDFISIFLPSVKFGGSTADDGEKGLIQTMPFTVIKGAGGTGLDATEIVIQDSKFV